MKRNILLVLGLAGALWTMHRLAILPDRTVPNRPDAQVAASNTPDAFDDSNAGDDQCAPPSARSARSVEEQTTPAERAASADPDEPTIPQLETAAPAVARNIATQAAAEEPVVSRPADAAADSPALDAPALGLIPADAAAANAPPTVQPPAAEPPHAARKAPAAPAAPAPDRAAMARWIERAMGDLADRIAAELRGSATAEIDRAVQMTSLAADSAGSIADRFRAMQAAPASAKPADQHAIAAEVQFKDAADSTANESKPTESPAKPPAAAAPADQASTEPAAKAHDSADRKSTDDETSSAESAPSAPPAVAKPQSPRRPPLSPRMQELAYKVHRALDLYRHDRLINTGIQTPWEVMHRFVAFGIPTEIERDAPGGRRVNAIGWLLWGGRCAGQPLLVRRGDHPEALVGVGVEGHPGQFLGMLAQSRVSPDSPFTLGGKKFTVRDLIEVEKRDCDTQMELTFKLIAFSYYLDTNEQWTANNGEQWSISRLVREELKQPIQGAACGGSHRLFGLTMSYKMRIAQGVPVDGEFLRAQHFIHDYQRYAMYRLRNDDGSFSTDWFRRAADSGNPARKLQTTGHILEWLVFSLEDDQLNDPRVIDTVDFLATLLIENPNKQWSIGPLGHALHALVMYDDRVFDPDAPAGVEALARRGAVRVPSASSLKTSAIAPAGKSPSASTRRKLRPASERPEQPAAQPSGPQPSRAPFSRTEIVSAAK